MHKEESKDFWKLQVRILEIRFVIHSDKIIEE